MVHMCLAAALPSFARAVVLCADRFGGDADFRLNGWVFRASHPRLDLMAQVRAPAYHSVA